MGFLGVCLGLAAWAGRPVGGAELVLRPPPRYLQPGGAGLTDEPCLFPCDLHSLPLNGPVTAERNQVLMTPVTEHFCGSRFTVLEKGFGPRGAMWS